MSPVRALVLLLAAALAACASEVRITREYIPQAGVPGHADYAAARGKLPVVILNGPAPAVDVLAALRANDPRRHQFTTELPASLDGGYRIVLAFGEVPPGPHGCRLSPDAAPNVARAEAPAGMSVYAAFCLGPVLLSEAVATARIQSAADLGFMRLMGDLLSAIMSYRDPHESIIEDS